jgi:predicted esterase
MRNFLMVLVCVLGHLMVVAQSHEPKSLKASSNGETVGFYQFLPAGYSKSNKHPVIVFLHGIGERGNGTSEVSRVLGVGIASDIKNGDKMTFTWNGKTESFIVLTPQLNSKYGNWQNFVIDEMIDYAVNVLGADANRVYLTGLSLGGGGVWNYAASTAERAKKLAAIVPICGTCQSMNWANLTNANVAVWGFHAKDDGTVGVGCTTGHIYAINNQNPAVKPYMTIWDNGGHGIWDRVYMPEYTYNNPSIYEWMLGQSRGRAVNVRPQISAPNVSTSTGNSATLDASGSTDRDGKILKYIWKQISGPNTATLTNAESAKATISNLAEGTYTFEIKVIDDRADWVTQNVTVTVAKGTTTNKSPIASAGSNQTITLPTSSATLNGSGSYDPDGSITKYEWTKVSGGTATIASPNAANTQITNLAQGSYSFRLTVTDNQGASAQATVNITVNAAAGGSTNPQVSVIAGSDQTINLPTTSVQVDGSRSSDTRGDIKKWEWKRISGPAQHTIANYETAKTTISNLVEGTYQFTLTIWDNSWTPQRDTLKITVLPNTGGNNSGSTKADAGADQSINTSTTTLDGSKSSDAKGVIKEYRWAKISGPASFTIANTAQAKTTVSNLAVGTYQFRLTIWDNAWVPYSDTVTIVVKQITDDNNNSPGTNPEPVPTKTTVNAGPNQTLTLPTNSVILDGSKSIDPKGSIKRWEWTKISGPASFTLANAATSKATVSNLVRGTYQFLLTIWDNNWIPYSTSVTVLVKNAGEQDVVIPTSPVVNAGNDQTITLPTNNVTLDGSKSVDPRGAIKQYQWTKISGPANFTLSNATQAVAGVTNLSAGTYQFRLTIWNNDWVPMSDTVTIKVNSSAARVANAGTMAVVTAEEPTSVVGLKLYPNPATSLLQVEMSNNLTGKSNISIFTNSGSLVKQVNFDKTNFYQTQSVDVAELTPGTYFARVNISTGNSSTIAFIKQ